MVVGVGDLRLARARVGQTAEARGRWLLRFAERDLTPLTPAEWPALGAEALAFALPTWGGGLGVPAPSAESVRRWQWALKAGLKRLVQERHWDVAIGRRVVRVAYRAGALEAGSRWTGEHFEREVRDAFFEEVAATLGAQGRRFRFCQECGRAFIARKRQAYCTGRCSQRFRTRKFRQAHPERVGRHRGPREHTNQLGTTGARRGA